MHNELKYLFVINPVSGGKQKQEWEEAICSFFKDRPYEVQTYLLNGKEDRESLDHHIASFQPRYVVAVGGDGTIKMVAELLRGTNMIMGILPAGSANGMAKELNIPQEPEEALKVLVEGQLRKIDVININENQICVHLSDVGMNALIVRYFENYKGRGWISYMKALWRVLWRKRKFTCTIKTDKGIVRRRAYMVVIANATKYGMGAVINPVGDLSDGSFEVIIIRKLNVFAVLNGMFRGKPFHPKKIEIITTKTLELTTRRKRHFQIDGEYLGKHQHLKASIDAAALQLLVPQ